MSIIIIIKSVREATAVIGAEIKPYGKEKRLSFVENMAVVAGRL